MFQIIDSDLWVYVVISVVSALIGYAFSVSTIMKQCADNTELRVQILEILNRERMLIDEYRDFVLDTKEINQQVKNFFESVETKR